MAKAVKKGDKVEWPTSQGKTKGTVKKKLTSPTKIKGHKVAASKANPEFLVESSKSGKKAAHKAEALTKVSKKSAGTKKSSTKKASPAKTTKKSAAKTAGKKSTTAKKPTTAKKTSKSGTAKKAASVKKLPTSKNARNAKKTGATKKSSKPASAKAMEPNNKDEIIREFKSVVNIPPGQLERWLQQPDSKKVGFKDEKKGESVGHESGRRILTILAKRRDKLSDEDLGHMQKVIGYVHRHLAQKPKGDIVASNWRYSLMNWGHDPTK